MDYGENSQFKKSRPAQNFSGSRFSGSFANAFSATKQASSNTSFQLRSPFARLNSNTNISNQSGVERDTVKRERQEDDGTVATARISSGATADRPDHADDSCHARNYHSLLASNFGSGNSQLLPKQVYIRKAESPTSSRDLACLPEHRSDWLAVDISKIARASQDVSPLPPAISHIHSSPMSNLQNSPIVKSLNATVREIHNYPSSDGHHRSHSSVPSQPEDTADDLSALMFKGATDLRGAKIALEQKARFRDFVSL